MDHLTAKKRARPLAHKNTTSHTENDSVDDCSLNSIMNGFYNAVDEGKLWTSSFQNWKNILIEQF